MPDLHGANAIYDDRGRVFLAPRTRQISWHDTMPFMRIPLTRAYPAAERALLATGGQRAAVS